MVRKICIAAHVLIRLYEGTYQYIYIYIYIYIFLPYIHIAGNRWKILRTVLKKVIVILEISRKFDMETLVQKWSSAIYTRDLHG